MPRRKSQFQIWYEAVKRELLQTEPKNILARSECCKKTIDECVATINMELSLPSVLPSQQYESHVVPSDHLSFLISWPGLRIDASPKAPKSKKEYEKKSKNWLNGRRAPNYGKTLFPFFIESAEKYLFKISKILIKDDDEQQKLYYEIAIHLVLAKLCGISVTLHEQAKKAPFFCKNSVERKGKLKSLLQSYAPDHQYIQGFPSCFEEAVGYFKKKSSEYLDKYKENYLNETPKKFAKKESRQPQTVIVVAKSDDKYWKKQVTDLECQIANERKMRQEAEQERDYLRQLLGSNSNRICNDDSLNSSSNGSISSFATSSPPMNNNNALNLQPVPAMYATNAVNAPFQINHAAVGYNVNDVYTQSNNNNNNYVQHVPPSITMPVMQSNVSNIPATCNIFIPNENISNMERQRSFDSFATFGQFGSDANFNFASPTSNSMYMLDNTGNVNSPFTFPSL